MDATVATSVRFVPREPDGWFTRLFDNKAFLTALCMLPTAGLLLVFLTYPLGLGLWLSLTDTTIGSKGLVYREAIDCSAPTKCAPARTGSRVRCG